MKLKKLLVSMGAVAAIGLSVPAQAVPVLGNLNDGLNHTSSVNGLWSLFVNLGDVVTVTARRLEPYDIWGIAYNGANGSGSQIAIGDDELPAYVGGSWGDPQFSFTATSTGEYSVGIWQYGATSGNQGIDYFVSARGATGNAVPLPGTLALLGIGLAALVARRRITV